VEVGATARAWTFPRAGFIAQAGKREMSSRRTGQAQTKDAVAGPERMLKKKAVATMYPTFMKMHPADTPQGPTDQAAFDLMKLQSAGTMRALGREAAVGTVMTGLEVRIGSMAQLRAVQGRTGQI